MRILFLDDNAERHRKFLQEHIGCDVVQAWTAKEAIAALAAAALVGREWDLVSLDHDLSDDQQLACVRGEDIAKAGEGTGYDVALWMEEHPVKVRHVVVHSFNPTGAERMAKALRHYRARRLPFGTWRAEAFSAAR